VRAVAAEAGWSTATLSRVLDGGGNVAPRTRERLREVVDRLGDRAPALRALDRGLRGQRAQLPDNSDPALLPS
jgi:DNA-binding LacI/PurR family transcriptional regulator